MHSDHISLHKYPFFPVTACFSYPIHQHVSFLCREVLIVDWVVTSASSFSCAFAFSRNKISMNYDGDDEHKVMVVQAQVISRCFVKVTSDSSSLSDLQFNCLHSWTRKHPWTRKLMSSILQYHFYLRSTGSWFKLITTNSSPRLFAALAPIRAFTWPQQL